MLGGIKHRIGVWLITVGNLLAGQGPSSIDDKDVDDAEAADAEIEIEIEIEPAPKLTGAEKAFEDYYGWSRRGIRVN